MPDDKGVFVLHPETKDIDKYQAQADKLNDLSNEHDKYWNYALHKIEFNLN